MGSEREGAAGDSTLTALYHRALPLVYGYLLPRCGSAGLAEDLTAGTFMAAVAAAKRDHPPDLTVAWLVGIARHKLVDHWRRIDLERRKLGVIDCDAEPAEDPWDAQVDVAAAHATVTELRSRGARFRNDIVTGTGGKQIIIEDPSGNPVELFQPILPQARMTQPTA